MNTSSRGFSLVELLVVISIIGVLVLIILPNLDTIRTRAIGNADARNMVSLRLALRDFYSACGYYPQTLVSGQNVNCDGSTGEKNVLLSSFLDNRVDVSVFTYHPLSLGGPTLDTFCIGYHVALTVDLKNGALGDDHDRKDVTDGVWNYCDMGTGSPPSVSINGLDSNGILDYVEPFGIGVSAS